MVKYWNNQKHSECQLVTICNAAIYHGIKPIERYGSQYITYCKQMGMIHGEEVEGRDFMEDLIAEKLKIMRMEGFYSFNWIKENLPVEFTLYSMFAPFWGNHSVLAVGANKEKKKILITNYAKGRLHWMKFDKLIKIKNGNKHPVKWVKKG